jgi:hypothetical protein
MYIMLNSEIGDESVVSHLSLQRNFGNHIGNSGNARPRSG